MARRLNNADTCEAHKESTFHLAVSEKEGQNQMRTFFFPFFLGGSLLTLILASAQAYYRTQGQRAQRRSQSPFCNFLIHRFQRPTFSTEKIQGLLGDGNHVFGPTRGEKPMLECRNWQMRIQI